jgi:hypothetical protein
VSLDPTHYGLIKDFEGRMKIVPSLIEAESLTVRGDVTFDHAVVIAGKAVIRAVDAAPKEIPSSLTRVDSQEVVV